MDSDLTTDEKNSKISKTLEKDRHIWDFEDDEDEDKYEIFEKEIWSENIIPLVKEILKTLLGPNNDIHESETGKYLVKSAKNGRLYLLDLHPYSYELLSILFIDQKLMAKIKIIKEYCKRNLKVFSKLLKYLKKSKSYSL